MKLYPIRVGCDTMDAVLLCDGGRCRWLKVDVVLLLIWFERFRDNGLVMCLTT